MKEYADIIFKNGVVITSNKDNKIEESVAIKNNKIIFVGNNDDVDKFSGSKTKVINLNNKSLLPGFIDSHIHFSMLGLNQGPVIDIDYSKAKSIKDIKLKIKNEVVNKKPGEWISCWGYDQNKLEDKRHPTIEDLDEVAPNNPVRCTRTCGHMGVYNSKALKLSGIEIEKFAPGEVVFEKGKLTGLLKESAHFYMENKVIFSEEDALKGIKAADNLMIRNGITTVHDAGSPGTYILRMIEQNTRNGNIKVRVHPMIFDLSGKESSKKLIDIYIKTGITTGFGNEKFSIGPAKIMLDGSSSGPSVATKEPYSHDPDLKGILVWQQEEVDEFIDKVHRAGFQVTAHAQGDLAIEIIVNAIEKALKQTPRKDHRHRIEHCGLPNLELIDRIKELGIVIIPNPGFFELNGTDYIKYYGERIKYMYPLKTYIEKGITAAIGSDAPVIKPDPMLGIYGALTRKDGKTKEVVGENQKIDILNAIKIYTYNGAYASFEEDIKGSIEVGKLADLVLLSDNILEVKDEKIKEIKVEMTMVDGKIVFES